MQTITLENHQASTLTNIGFFGRKHRNEWHQLYFCSNSIIILLTSNWFSEKYVEVNSKITHQDHPHSVHCIAQLLKQFFSTQTKHMYSIYCEPNLSPTMRTVNPLPSHIENMIQAMRKCGIGPSHNSQITLYIYVYIYNTRTAKGPSGHSQKKRSTENISHENQIGVAWCGS